MNDIDIQEAKLIRQKAPYPGIVFDVVKYDHMPTVRILRFYADNLNAFSDYKLDSIAEYIQKMLDELNSTIESRQYSYEVWIQ